MIAVNRQGTLTVSQSEHLQQHHQNLLDQARSALRGCAHHWLHRLDCSVEDGALTVRGVLPSFYLKQVVQETLRTQVTAEFRNLVTVLWK